MSEISVDTFTNAYITLNEIIEGLFGTIDSKDNQKIESLVAYLYKTYPDIQPDEMETTNDDELALRFMAGKIRDAYGLMLLNNSPQCKKSNGHIEYV